MTPSDPVSIVLDGATMQGDLAVPDEAQALVVFAHGSGSSRKSPRNQQVASFLHRAGLGTLLFDLLTAQEELEEQATRHLRFDIGLLASRLISATEWLESHTTIARRPLGLFGASTGAAAALVAAAHFGERVGAVVSRGGRPDLAGDALADVIAPTLLIVGARDEAVLRLNRQAAAVLRCPHRIEMVAGATHLFEEPGALERVAALAVDWFRQHLPPLPAEAGR
jgi:predicted alpha/beta-hydrolase family hydrolase